MMELWLFPTPWQGETTTETSRITRQERKEALKKGKM
jgi:hypothetical protein